MVPVEEYLENCIYDANGVKWLENFKTGMCNVLSAYSIACENMGVQVAGWRDDTPCPREVSRAGFRIRLTHECEYESSF